MAKQLSAKTEIQLLLEMSRNLIGKADDHETRLSKLEARMSVDSRNALNIRRRVVQHVTKLLGKEHPEYRKSISRLWHDYWNAFGVTSYLDTPAALYDEAIAYIDRWRPIALAEPEQSA